MHIVCPWHGWEFHLADGTHVIDRRALQNFDVDRANGERSMSQSEAASFEALASAIAGPCAHAIEQDRIDAIPNDSLGQVFAAWFGCSPRRLRRAGPRPFGRNSGVTPTDVDDRLQRAARNRRARGLRVRGLAGDVGHRPPHARIARQRIGQRGRMNTGSQLSRSRQRGVRHHDAAAHATSRRSSATTRIS